jgi:hypothetical protein
MDPRRKAAWGPLVDPREAFSNAQAVLSSSLKLVGSCRGPADEERIRTSKEQAAELGLEQALECRKSGHMSKSGSCILC